MLDFPRRPVDLPGHFGSVGWLLAGPHLSCRRVPPRASDLARPAPGHLDGFDLHANLWVPPPTIAPASSNSPAISSAPPRSGSPPPPPRRARPRRTPRRCGATAPPTFSSSPSNSSRSWRPAVNLLLYHGVLASRGRWRSQVVRYGRPAPDAAALTRETHPDIPGPAPSPTTPPPPRNPRQAAHRRCPITGSAQPPGPAVCPTPAALDHRRVPRGPSPQGVGAQRRRVRAFPGASRSAPRHSPAALPSAARPAPRRLPLKFPMRPRRGEGRARGAESSQRTSRLLDTGARRV